MASKRARFGVRATRNDIFTPASIKIPPLSAVLGEVQDELSSQFTVKKDLILNNLLTTTSIKMPIKTQLPGDGKVGDIIFNQDDATFYGFNGSTWITMSGGGGGGGLVNVGTGEKIYTENPTAPFELRTLISSDSSITIVQNADTLDLKVVGGGGGVGTLSQVLTAGNSAGGQDITNVGTITATVANVVELNITSTLTGPGVWVLLGSDILGATNPVLTVDNIPAGYKHLKCYVYGTTNTTGNVSVCIVFNNDTAQFKYDRLLMGASPFGVSAAYEPSVTGTQTFIYLTEFPGVIDSPDYRGFIEVSIPNYTAASYKTILSNGGSVSNGGAFANLLNNLGVWRDNSAITRIDMIIANGGVSFEAGSGLEVYGLK